MTNNIIMTFLVNTAVFSALFCVMMILRKTLAKRISPVLMLVMWFAVVLKLIVPFGFESKLSILPQPENAIVQTYEPLGNMPDAPEDNAPVYEYQDISPTSDTQQAVAAASDNITVPKTIDWKTIALGIWGAGVLLTGALLCLGVLNLKKRVRHSQADTPQHVQDIFEECRQALGIRRKIDVITQSALGSPLVMGVFKPVLVLPEDAVLDDRKLKHIFLHELTHYKRGDIWAIELMNILRALYWFNPLVWACFKLIRCDMETACDLKVINVLGQAQRLPYISTVLGFAGHKTSRLPAAAMGLSDGRPAMEKRIRGMFGKAKTGIRGRITAVLLAVLLLAAGILTACQPVISGTSTAAEYKTTGHWKETIQQDKLTIEIDTDIMQPNVSEYPIVTVEPVIFSQQRVDELVKYFAGDKKLYKPHGMTKADYAEQIASYLKPRWSGGRQIVTWQAQFEASQLEDLMKDAPQEYPKEYIDSTLTYDIEYIDDTTLGEYKNGGKNFVNAMVENGDGNDARIGVRNFTEEYDSTAFSYSTPMLMGYTPKTTFDAFVSNVEADPNAESVSDDKKNGHFDEYAALYENVTLKQEDALKAAEKAISDLGIKDLTLTSASKTVSLDHPDKGGWQFEYARQNGGIALTPFCGILDTDAMKPPEYIAPYYIEMLTVVVTEDGIQRFSWYDCVKQVETEPENAQLLPFDDIKKALINSISNIKPIEKILHNRTIKISSAKLSMGYVDTDDPMKMKIVPVWVFGVTGVEGQYMDINTNAYVINAIDGGTIAY